MALLAGGSSRIVDTDDCGRDATSAVGGRFLVRDDRRTASSEAADTVLSSSVVPGFLRQVLVERRLRERRGWDTATAAAATPTREKRKAAASGDDDTAMLCARLWDLLVEAMSLGPGPDAGGSGDEEDDEVEKEIC